MPPQHDQQEHLGLASEADDRPDPADPGTPAGEPEQPGEPEQHTETSARDPGHSGWSGRAVGPLSRLLPGGAAELNPGEAPAEPSASEVAVGEESPATPSAVDAAAEPEPDLTATDDRWHAVLVGFVDDPRGSVEAARALIDEDIAAHVALLARRREAMHAAWQAPEHSDTEALRVALMKYRDLRKRLADVVSRS